VVIDKRDEMPWDAEQYVTEDEERLYLKPQDTMSDELKILREFFSKPDHLNKRDMMNLISNRDNINQRDTQN
jgi:hypothetical protein